MQAQLRGLNGVHDLSFSVGLQDPELVSSGRWSRRMPPARRPLVLETSFGHSLYVGKHCSHVEGLDIQEGRELIRRLNRHITQSHFVYSHTWTAGDLVICDNRSCLHRGRLWHDQGVARRLLCLVKVSEPLDQASSPGHCSRPPPISRAEANAMLAAGGGGVPKIARVWEPPNLLPYPVLGLPSLHSEPA
mmetsp:Transcript_107104/g.345800  ORF Transcript_107104/g.345800 Transcript_107104/m.345800 type:complete len:190 (+) Transcript_107104:815-1384(+)